MWFRGGPTLKSLDPVTEFPCTVMFSLLSRRVCIPINLRVPAIHPPAQAFSTTAFRSSDVSKLILVGRLGKDPEVRITKSDKEYVSYAVFRRVTAFSFIHLLQLHSSHNELSAPPSGPRRRYASPRRITTRTDAFVPARPESKTTWHHILSFNPSLTNYLRNLRKGSHVYVEANFELREPDPSADPNTPQGQRQIFLRHGTCSVSCLPHAYVTLL